MAIRIVYPDEAHSSLHVDDQALHVLENLTGSVRVCSLSGTQREGKSTLLNLLVDRTGCKGLFGIGHSTNPHTTGLWLQEGHGSHTVSPLPLANDWLKNFESCSLIRRVSIHLIFRHSTTGHYLLSRCY